VIDPVAPRHCAVTEEGKVLVTLDNGPAQLELLTVSKHKKNPAVGVKTLYRTSTILIDQQDAQALSPGEEVRAFAVLFAVLFVLGFIHVLSCIR
jgi:glutamyl-tRNA synthetase